MAGQAHEVLWLRVAEHTDIMKYNLPNAKEKESQVAEPQLQKEVEQLQLFCDEIQQRNVKGNIIISSPKLGNSKVSLMKQLVATGLRL